MKYTPYCRSRLIELCRASSKINEISPWSNRYNRAIHAGVRETNWEISSTGRPHDTVGSAYGITTSTRCVIPPSVSLIRTEVPGFEK